MIRWQVFVFVAAVSSLVVGCARESADELFSKGEAATHRVATYGEAESHLEAFLRHYPNDPRADVALQALARITQSRVRLPKPLSDTRSWCADSPKAGMWTRRSS